MEAIFSHYVGMVYEEQCWLKETLTIGSSGANEDILQAMKMILEKKEEKEEEFIMYNGYYFVAFNDIKANIWYISWYQRGNR